MNRTVSVCRLAVVACALLCLYAGFVLCSPARDAESYLPGTSSPVPANRDSRIGAGDANGLRGLPELVDKGSRGSAEPIESPATHENDDVATPRVDHGAAPQRLVVSAELLDRLHGDLREHGRQAWERVAKAQDRADASGALADLESVHRLAAYANRLDAASLAMAAGRFSIIPAASDDTSVDAYRRRFSDRSVEPAVELLLLVPNDSEAVRDYDDASRDVALARAAEEAELWNQLPLEERRRRLEESETARLDSLEIRARFRRGEITLDRYLAMLRESRKAPPGLRIDIDRRTLVARPR